MTLLRDKGVASVIASNHLPARGWRLLKRSWRPKEGWEEGIISRASIIIQCDIMGKYDKTWQQRTYFARLRPTLHITLKQIFVREESHFQSTCAALNRPTYSLTHLLTNSLTHSFTRSLPHSQSQAVSAPQVCLVPVICCVYGGGGNLLCVMVARWWCRVQVHPPMRCWEVGITIKELSKKYLLRIITTLSIRYLRACFQSQGPPPPRGIVGCIRRLRLLCGQNTKIQSRYSGGDDSGSTIGFHGTDSVVRVKWS